MLPDYILRQLSPAAAKIYLILLLRHERIQKFRLCQISIDQLTDLSARSPRTCAKAIKELIGLGLLLRIPRQYHTPNAYQLLSPPPESLVPPSPSPSTNPKPASSNLQPASAMSPTNLQPASSNLKRASTNLQPAAALSPLAPKPTPISSSKTQNLQPAAGLLTDNPTTPDEIEAYVRAVYSSCTPEEKAELIALSQATLARLDQQEAKP